MSVNLPACANMWRITKYDPAFRNEAGRYTRTEWTFFAQIGSIVAGEMVTFADYLHIENACVSTAIKFVAEAGIQSLAITELQNPGACECLVNCDGITTSIGAIREGLRVSGNALEDLIRLILREAVWCKLAGDDFYVHFGWDYYMYLGSCSPCPNAIAFARQAGLFVEDCASPYGVS